MPRCPNCGRDTLRTEDWACQWCGHPLLSSAFKRIPKTYRELQEERGLNVRSAQREEPETAGVIEAEVVEEPALEPAPQEETEPEAPPPAEPVAVVEAEAETEKEPPPPEPPAEATERSEPVDEPEPEPVAEAEMEPVPETEPLPEAEPAEEPVAEAAPEAAPEVAPEPAQAPVAVPTREPDPATGTINATVDELIAAFTSDKAGTNAKLLNKSLTVTGAVQKIFARDNLDIFYILLAGAGKSSSSLQVRCTFSREHSTPLSRLTEGQTATVQGTYVGCERNIILKDCRLVT